MTFYCEQKKAGFPHMEPAFLFAEVLELLALRRGGGAGRNGRRRSLHGIAAAVGRANLAVAGAERESRKTGSK